MITVNAMGDKCPIPIIKTKEAIASFNGGGQAEVLVDNEIAVQNLTKMANQKGYDISSEKTGDNAYRVIITVGEGEAEQAAETPACYADMRSDTVVVISSDTMGSGDRTLGTALLKGFIFALSKQDILPRTILFYNSGAYVSAEGSDSIEDLKNMEAMGVEIFTCGTCINHYGLSDKPPVGSVTNMYAIAEAMTGAGKIVKPC